MSKLLVGVLFLLETTQQLKAEQEMKIIMAQELDMIKTQQRVECKVVADKVKIFNNLQLAGPVDVAISNNGQYIAVTEYDAHCVTILHSNGNKLRSFGTRGTGNGQFICPCGVTFTSDDEYILVTDQNRLQKLTLDGQFVMSVGSSEEGSGPLEFNLPIGVAIHPMSQQIYVGDTCNHRIQVITDDFKFSHYITQLGSPRNVAFDGEGNVYATNCDNDCVDVFTAEGKHLRRIKVREHYEFDCSFWIAIARDLLYTCDWQTSIVAIYTTGGELVKQNSWAEVLHSPYGITVDSMGNIHVCDFGHNRIVII